MSNMDKVTRNKLFFWEEVPSTHCWFNIREELDRLELSQRVLCHEVKPKTTLIRKVSNNPRSAKTILSAALAASILLILSLWLVYSNQIETASELSINTPSSRPYSQTTLSSAVETATDSIPADEPPTPLRGATGLSKYNIVNNDYIWFANERGAPVRVPTRWESLSCCLSGENESTDCRMQRAQWHSELLETDLGFQADPFLGLVALLNIQQNP